MKVEEWFKNGTGFKIKELRYLKPPELPYFLFENKKVYRGADLINNLIENSITIERYSETNNDEDLKEIEKVNAFLEENYHEYDKQTDWLDSESMYGTVWIIKPILEKIRKEEK